MELLTTKIKFLDHFKIYTFDTLLSLNGLESASGWSDFLFPIETPIKNTKLFPDEKELSYKVETFSG